MSLHTAPVHIRGCTGKIRHSSHHKAAVALRRQLRNDRFHAEECRLEVYKCRHCSGWHLGHSQTPVRRHA